MVSDGHLQRAAIARIDFVGRKPPTAKAYATTCRLPSEPEDRPGQWSLVLTFIGPPEHRTPAVAEVKFLVPGAPHHMLLKGTKLELYEGNKKVANVRIISDPDHPDSLAVMDLLRPMMGR